MGTTEKKYVKGDLFDNIGGFNGYTIIPHIVNSVGAWGSGFVVPLAKHFPQSKKMYLKHWESFNLGDVQFVRCSDSVTVANMFAQEGILGQNSKPIRYTALLKCMENVRYVIDNSKTPCRIVAPKFGSLRACGNWELIEELIQEVWADLDVTIIEFGE